MRHLLIAAVLAASPATASGASSRVEREVELTPDLVRISPGRSLRAATLRGIPPITGGSMTFRFSCALATNGCVRLSPGMTAAMSNFERERLATMKYLAAQSATEEDRLLKIANFRIDTYRFVQTRDPFDGRVFIVEETVSEADRAPETFPAPDVDIEQIVWTTGPDRTLDLYPPSAIRRRVEAKVQLTCQITKDLVPLCIDAKVIPPVSPDLDQSTADRFGSIAYLISSQYRAKEKLKDGSSSVGRTFIRVVSFNLAK